MTRRLASCLVVFAALVATARADDEPKLTEEDRADLAWLDGLGYPVLGGRPFVEVTRKDSPDIRGFVLAEDDARLGVISAGFQEWALERGPGVVVSEPMSLESLASEWLNGAAAPTVTASTENWITPDEPSIRTQSVICAWALFHDDGTQDKGLVHDLLAHARTMRDPECEDEDASKQFRAQIADDLAAAELCRAEVGPCSDSAARRELFRAILRRFPGSTSEEEAKEFADLLDRMVRDDAEHAKTARPLEELTGDERRRELVFRLRRQEGKGDPIIVMGHAGMIDGPYVELVKDGLAAVPVLIEALDDDSLTCIGGYSRKMSPYVVRVQTVATEAIEAIAGRWFTMSDGKSDDDVPWRTRVRRRIDAWYAEVKEVGEVESLVREVARTGEGRTAEALLAKAPDRYPAAVVRALSAPDMHAMTRGLLVQRIAGSPGDACLGALRREAAAGEPLARLSAARLLADVGDAVAADALLALWRERRDSGKPRTYLPWRSYADCRVEELRMIVEPLVAMRRADVVHALAEGLARLGPSPRRVVVEPLAAARATVDGDLAAAMDAALADALDDPTEGRAYVDESKPAAGLLPRTCDAAAAALAATRGLPAPTESDSFAARDAKVAAVAKACGRPLRAPVQTSAVTAGAFDIRLVRFVPDDAGLSDDLRTKVAALVGKPFTRATLADVAQEIVRSGASATFDADRAADAPGVVVTLTRVPGAGAGWLSDTHVIVGGRWIAAGASDKWHDLPRDDGSLARLADKALAAKPGERVRLHFSAVRRDEDD